MQQATRDCRSCHVRRIKCDRTLPTCLKCDKKKIQCPGYGAHFRWANAVAVRGHLAGLSTPVAASEATSSKTDTDGRLLTPTSDGTVAGTSNQSASLFKDESSDSGRMIAHFVTAIAPTMVWLDSADNCYKRLVPPLAKRHPVLLLAIRAISAAQMDGDPVVWKRARDSAIQKITESIRPMVVDGVADWSYNPTSSLDDEFLKALLISMMLLSNYSLLHSDMGEAQFHRQAARILVNALTVQGRPEDELFTFIRNQLAIYEVLAGTTLSTAEQIKFAVTPRDDDQNVLFGRFLIVLHQVTVTSMSPTIQGHQQSALTDMIIVEDAFEQALCATMLAAAPLLQHRSANARSGFIQIAQLYHHAALVYACDRLAYEGSSERRASHAASLFRALAQMQEFGLFLQNLPWPVFIAGTCAVGSEQQALVRNLMNRICTQMAYHHYRDLIVFLDTLWCDTQTGWIALARKWELAGNPVIAI